MYGLMDCSNFFVSCERVFNPSLHNKPVVVLSSNDGCIIARSEEVKALGIPMGAPLFKVRDIMRQNQVQAYSSNFALYSDMSDRTLMILDQLGLSYEPYSIDESFIKFPISMTQEELTQKGIIIRETMKKYLGLPVRIGFGLTKTLAKLANNFAKEKESQILHSEEIPLSVFRNILVEEIWGIGRRQARTLAAHNIYTVQQLLSVPERWIRDKFNIVMLRTVRELKGQPCFENEPSPQKSFMISRTFAEPVTSFDALKERIALFVSQAGEKLRKKGLLAREIGVFTMTDRFHQETYSYNQRSKLFSQYTQDTRLMIRGAFECLVHMYQEGKIYKKAGVYLGDTSTHIRQLSLFEDCPSGTSSALMKAMDSLNKRYGSSKVRFGSCGTSLKEGLSSMVKREKLSPRYTTSWKDLLQVK